MQAANSPPVPAAGSSQLQTPRIDGGTAPDHELPDLLHATPCYRIDRENTRLAIVLAFSGGASGGLFADALDRAALAPSSWNPDLYVRDIFLAEFVTQCFKVRIGREDFTLSSAYLVRVLSKPPADATTIQYRRAIAAELARSPQQRHDLEQLYLELRHFRSRLEGATGIGRWDAQRRQLDILQLLKGIIDRLSGSGLSRLSAFGQTYAFVPGVARTSLAGQAAARLGVTGDQLMSLIERNIAQSRS